MRPYIDLHCDTVSVMEQKHLTHIFPNQNTMVDIERLSEAKAALQVFAMWMMNDSLPENAERLDIPCMITGEEQGEIQMKLFAETLEQYREVLRPVRCYADYEANRRDGVVSAMLSMEDGYVVRNLDNLRYYYERGVRLITLTWNYENSIGYPNSAIPEVMRRPLKPFGREVVSQMNRLGMLVDVSHLNEGGFYSVAETSVKPFVASHSCCMALAEHRRNLTDDQLRTVAEKGGVVGINFCPRFLTDDGKQESRLADIIRHIEHMRQVGGEDILAIGTDFDGVKGKLEIGCPADLDRMFDALRDTYGYSEKLLDKLARENAERVLKDVLG